MRGYFEQAQVTITSAKGRASGEWIIQAEGIRYEITEDDVIILRITQDVARKKADVKVEPCGDKEEGARGKEENITGKEDDEGEAEDEGGPTIPATTHEDGTRTTTTTTTTCGVGGLGHEHDASAVAVTGTEEAISDDEARRAISHMQKNHKILEESSDVVKEEEEEEKSMSHSHKHNDRNRDEEGHGADADADADADSEDDDDDYADDDDDDSPKKQAQAQEDGGVRANVKGGIDKNPYVRRCVVTGCSSYGQGPNLKQKDAFGAPGARCMRHGGGYKTTVKSKTGGVPIDIPTKGRRCSATGCHSFGQGPSVQRGDTCGPPGPRCVRHGGGNKCAVKSGVRSCGKMALGTKRGPDAYGDKGYRCKRHGGRPSYVSKKNA